MSPEKESPPGCLKSALGELVVILIIYLPQGFVAHLGTLDSETQAAFDQRETEIRKLFGI